MSDNNNPNFLSEEDGELTLDQLVCEQKPSPTLWDKAFEIVTEYPKCLTKVIDGAAKYHVSPKTEINRQRNTAEFAVAVALDGKEKSDEPTLFLIKNGDMAKRIMILRHDHFETSPLLIVDTLKPVRPEGFDQVLDTIKTTTASAEYERQCEEKRRKNNRFRKLKNAKSEVGDFMGFIAPPLLIIGIPVGLVFGIPAAIMSHDDANYQNHMETVVAQFDETHQDFELDGTAIAIGSETVIPGGGYDPAVGIPWAKTVDANGQMPRTFTVTTGSCATSYEVEEVGPILGDQVIVATTDAPDGLIRVRVNEGAGVDVCALEPEGDDYSKDIGYIVALQPQPATDYPDVDLYGYSNDETEAAAAAQARYEDKYGASYGSSPYPPPGYNYPDVDHQVNIPGMDSGTIDESVDDGKSAVERAYEGYNGIPVASNAYGGISAPYSEAEITALEKAAIDAGFDPEFVEWHADFARDALGVESYSPPSPPESP